MDLIEVINSGVDVQSSFCTRCNKWSKAGNSRVFAKGGTAQ